MALKDNLISYWKLEEASGTRYDSHGTNDLTDNNTVGSATGLISTAADFEADNLEYLNHADNASLSTTGSFTFAFWMKVESFTGFPTMAGKGGFFLREWSVDMSSGTTLRFVNQSLQTVTYSGTISTGTWYFVVVWWDADLSTLNIQVNDGAVDTLTSAISISDITGDFYLGAYGDFDRYFDGLIDEAWFSKRVYTSDERTEIYNSGAGLSYDDWDAASGITVTPTTATLTLTTFAPTVRTPRLCTPTTATLTLTTFAPTVSTPRLCTPTTLALSLTTFAPTVRLGETVTPTTLAFTLSTFAPTISLPNLCTPTTLALSITSFAPTVTGGQGLTVTPTTLALTLATFAPTIINPNSATPITLALSLTTFAPTVSAPRLCTPTTLALSLTTFAPTINLPNLVTPTTKALTLTAFAPTVLSPRLVTPTTLALSLTTFEPTITVDTGTTVTPTTLALSITTFAPTITNPQTYVPTTLAFTLTAFAPTITVAPVDTGPPNRVGGGGQGGGAILGYQTVEIDFESDIERLKFETETLRLKQQSLLLAMKIQRQKDEDELIYLGVL